MNQFVSTEVHCTTGRADCIVEFKDKVYIFEFKLTSNGSAEDAVKQIKEKGYKDKYSGSGIIIRMVILGLINGIQSGRKYKT